jgi:hypothetical protein
MPLVMRGYFCLRVVQVVEKILNLTLKKQWFDMIKSNEKKEEYREIKDYWIRRLVNKDVQRGFNEAERQGVYIYKPFTHIVFTNGYGKDKPSFKIELKSLKMGQGKENLGAIKGEWYFVLYLGEVV